MISAFTFLPLLGALVIVLLPASRVGWVRYVALVTSVITFCLAGWAVRHFASVHWQREDVYILRGEVKAPSADPLVDNSNVKATAADGFGAEMLTQTDTPAPSPTNAPAVTSPALAPAPAPASELTPAPAPGSVPDTSPVAATNEAPKPSPFDPLPPVPAATQPAVEIHRMAPVVHPEITANDTAAILVEAQRDRAAPIVAPPAYMFEENYEWIPTIGVRYHVGLGGLNVLMVLLTALLAPLCVWSSSTNLNHDRLYWCLLLGQFTFLFGAFTALDFVHWYMFWELSLVPAYFLIKLYGGHRRHTASTSFILWSIAGSVCLLLAFQYIYVRMGTMNLLELAEQARAGTLRNELGSASGWVLMGICVGLFVKAPLFPFNVWQRDAYTQAPVPVTVILSALLSKLGVYGFFLLALPLFSWEIFYWRDWIFALAVGTVLIGALAAWHARDLKTMLTYSSLSHVALCFLAITAATISWQRGPVLAKTGAAEPPTATATNSSANYTGDHAVLPASSAEIAAVTFGYSYKNWQAMALQGAILQMFAHGLISAGLFLALGMVEKRVLARSLALTPQPPGVGAPPATRPENPGEIWMGDAETTEKPGFTLPDIAGMRATHPRLFGAFFFLAMASLGLPFLAGFSAEMPLLAGSFALAPWWTLTVAPALFGTAWYVLNAVHVLFHGPPLPALASVSSTSLSTSALSSSSGANVSGIPAPAAFLTPTTAIAAEASSAAGSPGIPSAALADATSSDLTLGELVALGPLMVLILWAGLAPDIFLRMITSAVSTLAGLDL
ncbi:MAG: proton-conducting transporter membrane subunit [Candidatus Methylacidiphilales bacterium]